MQNKSEGNEHLFCICLTAAARFRGFLLLVCINLNQGVGYTDKNGGEPGYKTKKK